MAQTLDRRQSRNWLPAQINKRSLSRHQHLDAMADSKRRRISLSTLVYLQTSSTRWWPSPKGREINTGRLLQHPGA